jgi:hypothetical protein
MLSQGQHDIKKQVNESLSTALQFIPLNNHNNNQVYYINQLTNIYLLNQIITLVQKVRYFSVQVKFDQGLPTIIIELIRQPKSIILMIEIDYYLLHAQWTESLSLQCWLLRSLFQWIFHSKNVIYSWRDLIRTLSLIRGSNLLPKKFLREANIIDLQYEFNYWYSAKYENNTMDNYQWSLSQAIFFTFNQALNESITFNSCLAITKLAHWMGQDIGSKNFQLFL